jgi:uncharacterized protein YndB with AHSA1/START domain
MTDPITRFTAGTERTVLVAGERRGVRMTRRYATDVADLWSAWTDPVRTARWLGEQRGDRVVGGTVELVMAPPDSDVGTLTILVCDAPHHLRARWAWPGEADSVVDLRLVPDGDGTSLTLEHVALTAATASQYGPGWEDFLLRLSQHVAGDDVSGAATEATMAPLWRTTAATADDRWPTLDGGTIHAGVTVAADGAAVWDALTDAGGLTTWFGPTTGDLRLGGSWVIAWDGGPARGTVTECEPGVRFVTTWRWDHEPDLPDGTVTVSLHGVDGGTRVEVVQAGADGNPVGYGAGWYAHLGALAASLGAPETDWGAEWETARTVIRPLS